MKYLVMIKHTVVSEERNAIEYRMLDEGSCYSYDTWIDKLSRENSGSTMLVFEFKEEWIPSNHIKKV